jgi:hypothetical protein
MKIYGHQHAKLLIAELEGKRDNHHDDGNYDCPEVDDIQAAIEDLQKAFFETNDDFPVEDAKEILFSSGQLWVVQTAEENLQDWNQLPGDFSEIVSHVRKLESDAGVSSDTPVENYFGSTDEQHFRYLVMHEMNTSFSDWRKAIEIMLWG